MRTARSWLFVPASLPEMVAKALQSDADAVILDLEDSVPSDRKAEARELIPSLISSAAGKPVWLRVNARDSVWYEGDIRAALNAPSIEGILVPKVEHASSLASRLSLLREGAPPLKQGALIESARGVLTLFSLLQADAAIDMVMFGGAENADLQSDLQCSWSPEGIEMMHARQHTLLCGRAYAGVIVVDGVYSRVQDLVGLEMDTTLSRRLGFRARAAISPKQVALINKSYSSTCDETTRAERMVAGFEGALQEGRAATAVDGTLVDYAMYKAALRTLDRDQKTINN